MAFTGDAIETPTGSFTEVKRTSRPVMEYVLLDSDLTTLSTSGRLTAVGASLSLGCFGFASSCWLQLQATGLDPVHLGEVQMGEWAGIVGGLIFGGLALWGVITEETLIRKIRRTSAELPPRRVTVVEEVYHGPASASPALEHQVPGQT